MTILDGGCGALKGELAQTADWLGRRSPLREAVSDADGWFELSGLRASTYDLWASGPMGSAFVGAFPAGANVARVPLEAGAHITVDVKDGSSGQPLAGAQVALLPRVGGFAFLTASDAEGKAVFTRVPTGEYHAVASLPGRFVDAGAVRGDEVSLRLHVPRTLSGHVLRRGGGDTAGIRIRFEGQGLQGVADAQADGHFRVEELPPGSYALVARQGQEIATATVRVPEEGDLPDVQLSLEPCGEVAGRVVGATGAPLSGAEVELSVSRDDLSQKVRATTSSDGRFRFECLERGQVRLSVQARGHRSPGEPVVRELAAGSSLTFDFSLSAAAPARGRVEGPGGRGIGGVNITLTPIDVPGSSPSEGGARVGVGSTTTAGDGSFSVDGLAPGRYAYELRLDETSPEDRGEVRLPATGLKLMMKAARTPRGTPPEQTPGR